MATGGLGIYGKNQLAKRALSEAKEAAVGKSVDVVRKNSDEMLDVIIVGASLRDFRIQKSLEDLMTSKLSQITKEVVVNKSQQEVIKEIDEYFDNKGLDSSSEVMQLLFAVLKDGTK